MWWAEWPAIAAEIARMERDECLGCRQRDDTIKKLRAENEAQHVAHEFERQHMQSQIDALIAEKRSNLCRCDGLYETRG